MQKHSVLQAQVQNVLKNGIHKKTEAEQAIQKEVLRNLLKTLHFMHSGQISIKLHIW